MDRDTAATLMAKADEIRREASLRFRTGRLTAAEKELEYRRARELDDRARAMLNAQFPDVVTWAEAQLENSP